MDNLQTNTANLPPNEFHIGFTMAGAASAGCYTAGAMDYFFEIMNLWEDAKNGKLPEGWDESLLKHVPQHKVTVDAMGGTSAGGMTTVMATIYALTGKVAPVNTTENPTQKKGNVMYDSWVLMGDEAGKPLFLDTTLNTRDLDESGKIKSLLNSDFIDTICDNAFKNDSAPKNKLPYIADNLELVLSHTMLRGISLAVDFTTPAAQLRKTKKNVEHSSFEHFTISHFKLNYNAAADKDKYLPLEPFHPINNKALKLATMATGAFPVGLKFREFFQDELTTAYMQHITQKIVFNRLSDVPAADVPDMLFPQNFPNPYKFVSIDGGAINNEPFGEVLGILKERYGKKNADDAYKYALIMIDPFPDVPDTKPYEQPDDLFSVVPAIIGTLWDQSKVKRAEMLDAYSSDYYHGEIFPVRWQKKDDEEPNPIACGSAMAFGGLLDISFRQHDFFLGRLNARNFYRTFFSFPCEVAITQDSNGEDVYTINTSTCHPIHKDWTSDMIKMFKRPGKEKGTVLLPIVPDLYMLKEKFNGGEEPSPFEKAVPWPQYDAGKLFALKGKLQQRAKKMLELTYEKMTAEEKEKGKNPVSKAWMNKYYRTNLWTKFTGWIGNGILGLLFKWKKNSIAGRMAKAAIEWILKDLEQKGLLKNKGMK
ncbi:MAG: patatin-like phospholipase family protein [Chitinophagaceae bacterium]|nr:patatin-like phospholipase family protein [Chitinophagaceae bacterium]